MMLLAVEAVGASKCLKKWKILGTLLSLLLVFEFGRKERRANDSWVAPSMCVHADINQGLLRAGARVAPSKKYRL